MRIMIRQQNPGFIFTPNHRISPRLSGLSTVTSLRRVKCTNILPVRKFHCWTWRNYGRKLSPHFPSFKIIFHLPPLKLIAHSDNVKALEGSVHSQSPNAINVSVLFLNFLAYHCQPASDF